MTAPALPDGYTPLPPHKVAAIVTYLGVEAADAREAAGEAPAGLTLERLTGEAAARYRGLFQAVGTPWLWFSRLELDRAALAALLDDPLIEAYAVVSVADGSPRDIGLIEVDLRNAEEAELAFCGLVPEAVGRGIGRWMIARGIEIGFSRGAPRVMVHTCTLDHPSAVRAYERAGFRAYARAIEIADDPRRTGLLPRQAAPHYPLIG